MPLNSPGLTYLGRADEYNQFLTNSRAMGVLIQYRHITGTRRDCIGDKSRPASNSVFSFRLPDGGGLVSVTLNCNFSVNSTKET